jgi:hypothetical protein
MNNQEFIYWLNGFVDAVGEKGPTPKQWETIVSELGKVGEPIVYPTHTPNTAPIQTLPFIQPYNPHNPYKIYCGDTNLTATSGSGTVYGAFGGITTNGNTTWTNMPKGTNVSYTANLPKELLND